MTLTVTPNELKTLLPEILKARLVPMIHGSPAIGKSAIVAQLAEDLGLHMIDIRLSQLDPCDLLGFPQIDAESGRSRYLPMDTFPLKGDPLPFGLDGWLLFFDEFNHATPAVQKAAYRLVLDRQIGQYDLHPRAVCVAAGNLESDNALVEPMPTPLQSRMVHLRLEVDYKQWLEWAAEQQLDYRITSFIHFRPELLYSFRPDHTDMTYASPRTWAFADKLIRGKDLTAPHYLPLLAGTLGEGVAREFLGFTRIFHELPTIQQLLAAPETVAVPSEPSTLWALTGALANHLEADNADKLMKFIARLPIEYQVVSLREAIRRKPALNATKAIQQWVQRNANELF